MLLNIDTTPNLFHAALTLFMLATSYFLSSYRSMQTELDAARTDAAEERVSMQAELDAARTDAAGMQAELDAARTDAAEERVSMQAELDAARTDAAGMQAELDAARTDAAGMQAELDAARTDAAGMQAELDAARTELDKTELDKLRWRDLANDMKNRLYRAMYGSSSESWPPHRELLIS
ncbi:hypothetical protein EMIHUDRAFT_206391 [Emiliania huxleyi CCMP1516]|nr:hypothetical protein EMIHUDRAFT_206391 [Emiliania huxleyi CCMP1516]EOD25214.1 hypothetical protein EMIHUDRAFT_206391 [Emiliania huxleyi CCMP1516]|eukprot:XP_005777643.1 hypothetical protein EMIHUDRAFT_206391 [Emiliania huxleyi CCMP1516]